MMAKSQSKKSSGKTPAKKARPKSKVEPSATKNTINPTGSENDRRSIHEKPSQPKGAPFNDQDIQRRLGNFTTAGEAPRREGRSRGNKA